MAGLAGASGAGGGPLGGLGSLLAGKGLAAIVAGALVGAASGGALVATGAVHFGGGSGSGAASQARISLVACPDQGPVIGEVSAGEQVLVTGRTADNAWLELYYPAPGITEAWTPAGPLQLQGSLASLPVHACNAPPPSPSPAIVAEVSPSPPASPSPAISPSPEVSPSPEISPSPGPSPSPTPTPNVGPKLASLAASTKTLYYDPSSYCAKGSAETVTFSVNATDPNGVSAVALFWKEPGGSYNQRAMSKSGSKWSATLSSANDSINTAGTLSYYIQATDSQGATSKSPSSNANGLTVKVCGNTGPTITSARSDVTSVDTNPLGTGDCSNGWALGTGITVKATDVDVVKSVTMYYTGPGLAGYVPQALSTQGVAGSWFGSINPGSLGIIGNGTIKWYVVAVDTKGAKTQSSTHSIAVHRCDTATTFYVNSVRTGLYIFCPPKTTSVNLVWDFSIADPDGLVSATLSYRIVNSKTGQSTSSSVKVATSGGRFSLSSIALDGNTWFGSNDVTWTLTTVDKFGGTSSSSNKSTVSISVC